MNDNNSLLKRQKQLIYRANHRGIKEMDIVLGGFANKFLMSFDTDQLDQFEQLAAEHDRDLFCWFTGEKPVPVELETPMFKQVLAYAIKASQENLL